MTKPNVSIVGEGSSSGGEYGKVRVVGETVFLGSVHCETFKCTGEIKVEGDLRATEVKVTGTLLLRGNRQDDLSNYSLKSEQVKITGELKVTGDCEAEELKINGRIEAGGILTAEAIELKLHGDSRVRDMGGSHISVKGRSGIPVIGLFHGGHGRLSAEVIEGDRIYLENTEAAIVRGAKVEIGPGCNIGTVEYRDSLEIDKYAKVGSQFKL